MLEKRKFLIKEFISPQTASIASARPQDTILLINASGKASSTSLSIFKITPSRKLGYRSWKN